MSIFITANIESVELVKKKSKKRYVRDKYCSGFSWIFAITRRHVKHIPFRENCVSWINLVAERMPLFYDAASL